jgi:O-antigen ligase
MTTRMGNRFPLSRVASTAVGEIRLVVQAAPNGLRYIAPIVAWAVGSIGLGVVLGLSAVVLPPMGAFGIVAVAGLVLLWVMPDLPLVWPGVIRKSFFVMLVTDLCIPSYYTVQFSGLPWISARRVATFCLLLPFFVAVAASSDVRRQIAERIRTSSLIFICAIGFLVMATLSILTSISRTQSFSDLIDVVLSMYVPFFAMIYVARRKEDITLILKIICFCALFNTTAGVVQFFLRDNFFLHIFPTSMLDALITNNPALANLLPTNYQHFRHGHYRAESSFVTPLSFGEFEIIVIPIGLFFALHREKFFDTILGWAVVFGGVVGIFSSGSRAGFVGVIVSVAAFIAVWSIRTARQSRGSLGPAIAGLSGFILVGCVISLLFFSHTFHDMVLGGATETNSTQARYDQWAMGIPQIMANPITGHGLGTGGSVISNYTIDSYMLSLVLETGIPGLVFFVGMLLLPIWYGLRAYVTDLSEYGAAAGALACSFIAFTENRLVLSQRENHMLIFCLLGIVVVSNYERARTRIRYPLNNKSRGNTSYNTGGVLTRPVDAKNRRSVLNRIQGT